MRVPFPSAGSLGLLLIILAFAQPAAAQPFLIGLGRLPQDATQSIGDSVSSDGVFVVGHNQPLQGFRWSAAEGMIAAGPAGQARDVSDDGTVVGVGEGAWLWTLAGGTLPIASGAATGVSGNGQIVVGAMQNDAFRWTSSSGLLPLGYLPGDGRSIATDISKDGRVIVGGSGDFMGSIREATRWTAAQGWVGLGTLPGRSTSSADAVSGDGELVVGTSLGGGPGVAGFLWSAGSGMLDLGDLPGGTHFTVPSAVSDSGVVVGRSDAGEANLFEDTAFVWDAVQGIRPLAAVLGEAGLDVTGWTFENASDISPDGRFVTGSGSSPAGGTEAWLAFLPGGLVAPDSDADGVPDTEDNCIESPNGPALPDAGGHSQRDTDQDGYGNVCDADLDNSGSVDFIDLGALKAVFLGSAEDADLNGDGVVDFLDLGRMKARFFQPPGPSALAP